MAKLKTLCQVGLLFLCLLSILPVKADSENPFGQTFEINTYLNAIVGKPTWLLMIRNVETGEILPYLYEVKNDDNFWIALTYGRSYRVVASNMQWGSNKIIHNFCNLEGHTLTNKSYIITIKGKLSPNRDTSDCVAMKYTAYKFPIVNLEQ